MNALGEFGAQKIVHHTVTGQQTLADKAVRHHVYCEMSFARPARLGGMGDGMRMSGMLMGIIDHIERNGREGGCNFCVMRSAILGALPIEKIPHRGSIYFLSQLTGCDDRKEYHNGRSWI